MLAWIFWLFVICAISIAWYQGQRQERWFCYIIVMSIVATYFANDYLGWIEASSLILVVDGVLFAASLVLVSTSEKYWPIWFAAFQAIAVATSVAFQIFPSQVPQLYVNAQGFWFLPAMIAMVIGVLKDHKASVD